jgi:hypothetical protein
LRLRWLWYSKTTKQIPGDRQTVQFWEDRWINGLAVRELAPQLYACIPKRRHKNRTIAAGLQDHSWARDIQGNLGVNEVGQYLKICRLLEHFQLSDQPDQLTGWRLFRQVLLSRHVPWLYQVHPLGTNLENLGAAAGQVLPLAGHEELLLDR